MITPKPHRTCSEVGACQVRPDCQACGYPIGECRDVDGSGAACTRVHRPSVADPENPPAFPKTERDAPGCLYFLAFPIGVCALLLLAHILASR